MEEMLINERFKSPNKEFEKVFNLFRKKDYFDEKSQVKKKQEEFVRFLKKGDPMATKVFKQNKEDMKSSLSFIEDMVMDYNKKNHFEAFQIFSKAVNNIEMKDSKSAEKSGNFIKSKIHNNSQKYSLAIYSAIRKQKFNNYKDVHKDVDELVSKNESVNEGKTISSSKISMMGARVLNKISIGTIFNTEDGKYEITDYGRQANAFKEFEAEHNGKKVKVKLTAMYGVELEVTNDVRSTRFNKKVKLNSIILESVNEGKKRFKRQDGIGKAKYTISFHDGKKKHKDGSDFFDIKIFKNKKDLSDFVGTLAKQGYKLTRESVVTEGYQYFKGKMARDLKGDSGVKFKKGTKVTLEIQPNYYIIYGPNRKQISLDKQDFDSETLQQYVIYESANQEVPQGYNPVVEDKKQIKDLVKKVKHEKLFYDVLDTMEKKYGKNKYRIWLEKSLKDFGVNPKHYDYRTNAGAEEKLFQLGK